MSPKSKVQAAALLLLACICLLGAGCGVEGPPLAPLLNLPQPPEFQAVPRGDKVLISWVMPRMTTEAQNLTPDRLGPAEIFLAVLPGIRAQVSPAEFQANAQKIKTLPPSELLKAVIEYAAPLPGERAGNTAAYGVILKNNRGHDAGFSNIVVFPILAPLPPPAGLVIAPSEHEIRLQWPSVDGASAYALYRAVDGGPFQPRADVAAGANPVRYADPDLQFGHEYRYLVRSVRRQGEFRIESADSVAEAIKPEDIYPPQTPSGLVALVNDPAVELSWEPNTETDLAGYNVYRSENGQPPRRINKETLVSSAFRDAGARPGVSYSYSVTALDQQGNESRPSEAATAKP